MSNQLKAFPAKAGIHSNYYLTSYGSRIKSGITVFLTVLLFSFTAIAQGKDNKSQNEVKIEAEEEAIPSPLPDFCEFDISFPEDPERTERCDENGEQCFEEITYTKTYELSSSVKFRVSCNPVNETIQSYYTEQTMLQTLDAMTKRSIVESYKTSYREEETYRQAGLVGTGRVGRTPMIYIAQLWIGQNSALSLEAEIVGEEHHEGDALFSDVLRSVEVRE